MSDSPPAGSSPQAPDLTIVAPTYNERANVAPLVDAVASALDGVAWELLFVDDDSPDGTADAVREVSARDPRVRVLHRVGPRGLSSAVLEGADQARAPLVAVMDADLQHDPATLRDMLAACTRGAEVVVASRFADGASLLGLRGHRRWITAAGIALARWASGVDLRDPLSGYFLAPRALYAEASGRVSGLGFKILLDLLMAVDRPVPLAEVPTPFRKRQAGESKLGLGVMVDYVRLLWHHRQRRAAAGRAR